MTDQLALDFARTHSRRGGPESSRTAAERFVRSGKLSRHWQLILAAVKAHPHLTTKKLALVIPGLTEHQIGRRMCKMVERELIDRESHGEDAATWVARER